MEQATQTATPPPSSGGGEVSIIMRKRGTFEAWHHTPHQCVKQGTETYRYVLEICCPESELNDQGFVIDVADLEAHVAAIGRRERMQSCERMATRIVESVQSLLLVQGVRPDYVQCRLYGAAGGSILATTRRPQETEAAV